MQIPQPIFEQMIKHLLSVYPEEGCGFLGGVKHRISRLYQIENILHSRTRYEMNPKEQIKAFIDAEERREGIQAVYHSHPVGPEFPSETDINEAFYPEFVYLICSLKERENPVVRGFTIHDGVVQEVGLEVV